MDKVRNYFQHHPVVHWLMSALVLLGILVSGGLMLHEKNWPLLIGWSLGVPTALAVTRPLRKR
jgi:hypothetical protein